MARLIKCPRCQSQIDVTTVAGGSTIKCTDCDASIRVPTGQTSVRMKPATAAVPAAAAAEEKKESGTKRRTGGGKSSPIFAKMAGARAPGHGQRGNMLMGGRGAARHQNYAPLVVGAIVGGIGIVVVLLVVMNSNKPPDKGPQATSESASKQDSKFKDPYAKPEDPETPAPVGKGEEKKGTSLFKKTDGTYEAPTTWEPGTSKFVSRDATPIEVDASVTKEVEELLRKGDTRTLVEKADRYLGAVINSMCSDEEAIGRAAFKTMFEFCEVKKLQSEESGKNPVRLDLVNSAHVRAQEFGYWATVWYPKNRENLGPAQVIQPKLDSNAADWDQMLQKCRGGGPVEFEDQTRPAGVAMSQIKRMDRKLVYAKLVSYIDNEDIGMGRAACAILQYLTEHKEPLPTEQNKAQIKTRWQEWLSKN